MFACKVKYQNFGFECLRIDAKKFELKLGKAKVKLFVLTWLNPENFLIGNLFYSHHIPLLANIRNNVIKVCISNKSTNVGKKIRDFFCFIATQIHFVPMGNFCFQNKFIQMTRFCKHKHRILWYNEKLWILAQKMFKCQIASFER